MDKFNAEANSEFIRRLKESQQSKEPKITRDSRVQIPALMHPLFRTSYAIQNGVERNLIFRTWGGIGDQICAEPTIRYAIKHFKDCNISLASEQPNFFRHLFDDFKRIFDLKEELPNYERYFLFDTITPPDDSNLVWCFMSHMLTNCVDFPSLCALRLQLPVSEKDIRMSPREPDNAKKLYRGGVLIHPGKHWQSKTFPKSFWDRVIATLLVNRITPIIIGANADDNRGTVDVNIENCIDLRNKLSLEESVWLCMNAKVVLTNDSSPLHMAAPGRAWIGYIATCKHPDMISHWRNVNALTDKPNHNEWNWREVNHGKGGIWDVIDFCPNKAQKVEAEFVPPELLESWLPDPREYAMWAVEKYNEKDIVGFDMQAGLI